MIPTQHHFKGGILKILLQQITVFKGGEKTSAMPAPRPPLQSGVVQLQAALHGAYLPQCCQQGPEVLKHGWGSCRQLLGNGCGVCLALQTAQASLCSGVLSRSALPKHEAELESQCRIFILDKT